MHTRRRFLARALAGTLAGVLALPVSAPAAPARETFRRARCG
ncbi:twin-arginine translocation signal domain-containing protein [Achromobacter xylosoxidans]